MKANCKQLSLSNFIEDFDRFINTEKPIFLKLSQEYIDVKSLIPYSFNNSL